MAFATSSSQFTFRSSDFIQLGLQSLPSSSSSSSSSLSPSRSGYLLKQGTLNKSSLKRRYFTLVGNLLFYFENESSDTCLGMILTEGCSCEIVQPSEKKNENLYLFLLVTISGNISYLYATSAEQRWKWIEAIEANKFKSLSKNLTIRSRSSSEANLPLQPPPSPQIAPLPLPIPSPSDEQLKLLSNRIELLESTLKQTTARYEESEKERVLLLSSNGIIPKTNLPDWVLSPSPSVVRLWVGSWNMGAAQPVFPQRSSSSTNGNHLAPFVPTGYDMYCLGVQECVSESFFDEMDSTLAPYGTRRIRLDSQYHTHSHLTSQRSESQTFSAQYYSKATDGAMIGDDQPIQEDISEDPSKLCGRGDGSLLAMKYTGIAIYLHEKLLPFTRILCVTRRPFTSLHSKGAVAVAMSIQNRIFVFITCHLDAAKHELRRQQYRDIITSLGAQLGEEGYLLTNQFHHVIWCGDMNYRLVDPQTNQTLSSDKALTYLENNQNSTLFHRNDQLNIEKRAQEVFYSFREPEIFYNFYPTYKKIEKRPPIDYEKNENWAKLTYRTKYKEPFYKGGMIKERTPGYCDRILYWSIPDLADSLVPEKILFEYTVNPKEKTHHHGGGGTHTSKQTNTNTTTATEEKKILRHYVDNYQAVNQGEPWNMSDHSPVFGTFLLKLATNPKDESAEPDDTQPTPHLPLSVPLAPSSSSSLPIGRYKIILSDIKLIWGMFEDTPTRIEVIYPLPYENGVGPITSSACGFRSVPALHQSAGHWIQLPSKTNTCYHLKYQHPHSHSRVSIPIRPLELLWNSRQSRIPLEQLHLGVKVTVPSLSIQGKSASLNYTDDSMTGGGIETADDILIGHCTIDIGRICKIAINQLEEMNNIERISFQKQKTTPVASIAVATEGDGASLRAGEEGEEEKGGDHLHQSLPLNYESRSSEEPFERESFFSDSYEVITQQQIHHKIENTSISIARQLIKEGVPLYCIDISTMGRELVTFSCTMELIQEED